MEEKVPFKRKRKQSFLRKAKKYRKRGDSRRGHGTHVEDDVFQYFCRVLDVWNKGFDSEEDKRLFANNVLEQTKGSEMQLCTSQLVSRAIETVVDHASADSVRLLESALRADLRLAFVDRFCSHLTQKLILASARRVADGESEGEDPFVVVCIKFAVNNVEEFSWHMCACHVVRSCLEALSMLLSAEGSDYSEYPKLFYGTLIESPALNDICSVELGSGLVQALLRCLHKTNTKLCQKAVQTLLHQVLCPEPHAPTGTDHPATEGQGKDTSGAADTAVTVHRSFTSQPSIRLLECAIECSRSKRFTQIYAALFINRLRELSLDRAANMAVQALIRSAEDKTEFEGIFDEVVGSLEEVVRVGHTGVLVSLAATCRTLAARQGQLLHGVMRCLGCLESESELCSRLLSLDSLIESKQRMKEQDQSRETVSLHGSLIIQSLLHFHKPIKVINSLLQMETERLVTLMSDPRGCHISDAFFSAQYVGEKSREKLFHKVKERLVDLVTSKHGSRSFDALWGGIGVKLREVAAGKLCERLGVVTSSQFGSIIAGKIHLTTFRRDPKAWAVAIHPSDNHPRKLFSDIIGTKT